MAARKAIRLPLCKGAPNARRGWEYARAVVKGEVPAGKYVQLACQRALNDWQASKQLGAAYYYDAAEGERICAFIQLLPHTKGKWSRKREPIRLEPWQCFILSQLFGWLRKKDKTRRFRELYLEVPRKNGKSIIAAGIGLFLLGFDGEAGAEVYSGATTEKQAWEVFKPAQLMAKKSPDLCSAADIQINAKSLVALDAASKFEPVIGNPGDGSSPSCALIDEYHEHKNSDLFDTMQTGMGSREQPLLAVITTAGFNTSGPCYEKHREVQQLLENPADGAPELFGIIYSADEGDDPLALETLIKANPNYGVSVDEDFLKGRQADAARNPRKMAAYLTKHLNIWVNAKAAWLNLQDWLRCETQIDDEALAEQRCVFALDLAHRIDFTALVKLYFEQIDGKTHYTAKVRFFLPLARIEDDTTGNYAAWYRDGWIECSEGEELDFKDIERGVLEDAEQAQPEELAFDPWHAAQLSQRLSDEGLETIEFRQTVQNMSEPMKELEAAIKAGRFQVEANPVLRWMAGNVVAKIDAKENIYPRKEKPENKIDGIVALIMAVGRAMALAPEDGGSFDDYIADGIFI